MSPTWIPGRRIPGEDAQYWQCPVAGCGERFIAEKAPRCPAHAVLCVPAEEPPTQDDD